MDSWKRVQKLLEKSPERTRHNIDLAHGAKKGGPGPPSSPFSFLSPFPHSPCPCVLLVSLCPFCRFPSQASRGSCFCLGRSSPCPVEVPATQLPQGSTAPYEGGAGGPRSEGVCDKGGHADRCILAKTFSSGVLLMHSLAQFSSLYFVTWPSGALASAPVSFLS